MNNHVYYEVEGIDPISNQTYKANKRFSEFKELRKQLIEHWPGFYIPSLPSKKIEKTQDFIEQRRFYLE